MQFRWTLDNLYFTRFPALLLMCPELGLTATEQHLVPRDIEPLRDFGDRYATPDWLRELTRGTEAPFPSTYCLPEQGGAINTPEDRFPHIHPETPASIIPFFSSFSAPVHAGVLFLPPYAETALPYPPTFLPNHAPLLLRNF